MIPNKDSFIDLDTDVLDEYGLPRPRRQWKLGESDSKLHDDMNKWCRDILAASKAQIHSSSPKPITNHEVGGCRMGEDRRRSVLNSYCRSHDIPNLYVVDASAFPSSSEKNPTLTIMALAARAADHIGDRLKKGEA
jgi:choline dehydrogenase-like flavoprotein